MVLPNSIGERYLTWRDVCGRNWCFWFRTKKTPYDILKDRQTDKYCQKKCVVYTKTITKESWTCERGGFFFVRHNKNSPVDIVYYPSNRQTQKHCLVKFVSRMDEMLDAEEGFVIPDKRQSVKTPTIQPTCKWNTSVHRKRVIGKLHK